MGPPPKLEELVVNRRWLRRSQPFSHVVASGVFAEDFARELDEACRAVTSDRDHLVHFGWYDAYNWGFKAGMEWPLSIFTSAEWCDFIAGAMGVNRTPHVAGGIHFHDIGSKSGSVHCDLNPVYFPAGYDDPVQLPKSDLVSYQHGPKAGSDVEVTEVVRAISLIYYLGNAPWQPGDGGETGLYRYGDDLVVTPVAAVPPRNNSLVMFECTPWSFHTFLSNRRSSRSSVVMWLHRELKEADALFGARRFEHWES